MQCMMLLSLEIAVETAVLAVARFKTLKCHTIGMLLSLSVVNSSHVSVVLSSNTH